MRVLSLADGAVAPLETSALAPQRDPSCALCFLHNGTKTVCMAPEGSPGGILLIGDSPTLSDDQKGRPFCSDGGRWIRSQVARFWRGPVAFDYAVRCGRGSRTITTAYLDACRPYLASTYLEVQPSRVLVFGEQAAQQVLGYSAPPMSVRRGYGWVEDVPVFLFPAAVYNPILKKRVEADLEWALTVDPSTLRRIPATAVVQQIETAQDAEQAIAALSWQPWVAVDGEWSGRFWSSDFDLATLALCGPDLVPYVWSWSALYTESTLAPLRQLLQDPTIPKGGHSVEADLQAVRQIGVHPRGVGFDTLVERKAAESDADSHLDVAQVLVGAGGSKAAMEVALRGVLRAARLKRATPEILEEIGSDSGLPAYRRRPHVRAIRDSAEPGWRSYAYALVNERTRSIYCVRDLLSTAMLHQELPNRIPASAVQVIGTVATPAVEALDQIEAWGIRVDRQAAMAFSGLVWAQFQNTRAKLEARVPGVNWGSSAQVGAALVRLGVKLPKTKKGAPSTAAEGLEPLATTYEVVADLLELRRLKKQTEYADMIPKWAGPDDRIHATFNVTGARTGRLSVSKPPLHQIPKVEKSDDQQRTAESRMARDCYVAGLGNRLIQHDYNQLELREAAEQSGDRQMIAIFDAGKDLHLETAKLIAREVWGKDPNTITKDSYERSAVKSVNFGLLYGMSDVGLAARLHITTDKAAQLRRAILGTYVELARWIDECLRFAKRNGYCTTSWNGQPARVRDLYRIAERDRSVQSNAQNASVNTPIQGSASDLCLDAVVRVIRWIRAEMVPARLVLTVHDSLLSEVEEDFVVEYARKVREIMQGTRPRQVKLVVDVESGQSWGSLQRMQLAA